MDRILVVRFPVWNLLAQVICLLVKLLGFKGELWNPIRFYNFIIHNSVVHAWSLQLVWLLGLYEDSTVRFWHNIGLNLIQVPDECFLLGVLNRQVQLIYSFLLLKGQLALLQGLLHLSNCFLFFILRPDFSRNNLGNLERKQTVIDCQQEQQPVVSVLLVVNPP